jgi:glycerol-3-phosphate dehydrogenase (NAD(P)+)
MNIIILGGGSFGTALANQLSYNCLNDITILLRDIKVQNEINTKNSNSKYFLNKGLNSKIKATTNFEIIKSADVLFYSIPTNSISSVTSNVKYHLKSSTLVINVAKGIFDNGKTIVEYLKNKLLHENVISLKGASFSTEMMNRLPTLFTIGFDLKKQVDIVNEITVDTNIYIDSTTDVRGVELLSAIKNIYAILLGNIDAKFNSANTRFLILTKAMSEIKNIIVALGGKEETIFLSCGIGDISLTSLNDLSRNRTLGLLIGKGFFNPSFQENSVVLEGVKTLKLIDSIISDDLRKKITFVN